MYENCDVSFSEFERWNISWKWVHVLSVSKTILYYFNAENLTRLRNKNNKSFYSFKALLYVLVPEKRLENYYSWFLPIWLFQYFCYTEVKMYLQTDLKHFQSIVFLWNYAEIHLPGHLPVKLSKIFQRGLIGSLSHFVVKLRWLLRYIFTESCCCCQWKYFWFDLYFWLKFCCVRTVFDKNLMLKNQNKKAMTYKCWFLSFSSTLSHSSSYILKYSSSSCSLSHHIYSPIHAILFNHIDDDEDTIN